MLSTGTPHRFPAEVCEHEKIDFLQKKSDDAVMIKLKRELYDKVLELKKNTLGTESLSELMRMMESKGTEHTQGNGDLEPFQEENPLCSA